MLRRAQKRLAASVDHAFREAVLTRQKAPPHLDPESIVDRLDELIEGELAAVWRESTDTLFPAIAPSRVSTIRRPSTFRAHRVEDLRWPSTWAPLLSEGDRLAEAGHPTRFAHARLFSHRGRPRPTLVLIHGYLGGNHLVEERVWSLPFPYRRGFDVALFVLPHHGPRKGGGPFSSPRWPRPDAQVTIEGFRQAVMDLRSLLAFLRERGSQHVGLVGMSLGGYVTALAATIDPGLAFAIPFIPLASIPDFLRDGGQLPGTASQKARIHERLEEAYRIISPMARPPRLPRGARVVLGGSADRITPLSHSRRVAAHFEVPVTVFGGGHLLQVGRDAALDDIFGSFERQGVLPELRRSG